MISQRFYFLVAIKVTLATIDFPLLRVLLLLQYYRVKIFNITTKNKKRFK